MSQTLGPIHEKVYDNALVFDSLIKAMNLLTGIWFEPDKIAPKLEQKPLNEIIDHNNIHGWLSQRVYDADKRYIYALDILDRKCNIDMAYEILKANGAVQIAPKLVDGDLQSIFRQLPFLILEGMPCDRGIELIEIKDDAILWKINMDVHPYLKEVSLTEDRFLFYREAMINGILYQTDYCCNRIENNIFELRKCNERYS